MVGSFWVIRTAILILHACCSFAFFPHSHAFSMAFTVCVVHGLGEVYGHEAKQSSHTPSSFTVFGLPLLTQLQQALLGGCYSPYPQRQSTVGLWHGNQMRQAGRLAPPCFTFFGLPPFMQLQQGLLGGG